MRSILLAGVVAGALAGCLAPDGQDALVQDSIEHTSWYAPATVVAVVDTGIQPYHEVFKAPANWTPPDIPGVITLDDEFRSRVLQDLNVWNELQPDQLYYFEGTRVFGISKFEQSDAVNARENEYLIYDGGAEGLGHGTGTASLVAQASPHSAILMVEVSGTVTKSFEWLAEQHWIDVISHQQGRAGNTPSLASGPDVDALLTERIVGNGRIFVNAAGNTATPAIMDDASAPWLIVVGGVSESTHGASVLSSKLTDVVANFTSDRVAHKGDLTGYYRNGGTSFSSPVVAGSLAESLYQLRERYGDPGLHPAPGPLVNTSAKTITNADFRQALNATAVYWETTDYDPLGYPYQAPNDAVATSVPVVPVVPGTPIGPWVQMGWGFVDERLVPEIVAVLSGEKSMPEKPAGAYEWMQHVQEVKEEYWRIRQG